ncbi:DUF3606 domain-containing protein [Phenylobacterium sp. LjRoot225]|uniref:DUF3606 domain-containing protein n=1 Tax=Phenylobacterium sp. LjRoot225 TaxID=3342285 RepID=UPI003ECCD695
MQNKHPERREAERRAFETCRTIDVTDGKAMRFWSSRLGVTPEEIAAVVKEVGPNTTAVALKLEAPHQERIVPPSLSLR